MPTSQTDDGVDTTVQTVTERLEDDHRAGIDGIDHCADRVAEDWAAERVTARSAIVDPLRECLETTGVLGVLADGSL